MSASNNWLGYLASNILQPTFWLQISALLVCAGIGVMAWQCLQKLFLAKSQETTPPIFIGLRSFTQVFTPLSILFMLVIGQLLLAKWGVPTVLFQLAIPLLITFALMRFVFYVLQRIVVQDGSNDVSVIFSMVEKVFGVVLWLGVFLYISGLWPDVVAYLKNTTLPIARARVSLLDVLQVLISVLVTMMIALWIGALIEARVMGIATMHSSLRTVVARMARAFLILIAILLSLSLVGIDLTVLSILGGAFGVALGLGLQKIASSYVSGFVILFERSLSIGDMVSVEQHVGKVTQINSRYTVLEGLDGIESVVPNDVFMNNSVQNYSLTQPLLRLSTTVTIAYMNPIEPVLKQIENAVSVVPRVSHLTPPMTLLTKIGSDGLELEIGFWIVDPENGRLNIMSDVNRAIWNILWENNIAVAQVKRDVHVSSLSEPTNWLPYVVAPIPTPQASKTK